MNEPGPAPQGIASVICFGTSDRPRTQSARAAHTSKYFANPGTGRNIRNRKRLQSGSETRSVSDYGHGNCRQKMHPQVLTDKKRATRRYSPCRSNQSGSLRSSKNRKSGGPAANSTKCDEEGTGTDCSQMLYKDREYRTRKQIFRQKFSPLILRCNAAL